MKQEIIQRHAQLKAIRRDYEDDWEAIAERVAPSRARFKEQQSKEDPNKYKKRNNEIYDAVPALALQRFAAALSSLVTPKNQMWHDIKPVDTNLDEDKSVSEYTDAVRNRLFSARYSASFEVATQECYTDAGCFGNACMYIGENLGRSLYYKHVPLEQAYWEQNERGDIDWVNREFGLTARQAYQKWGDKLPRTIVDAAKGNNPSQVFWFIHSVFPNNEVKHDRKDHKGMAFKSVYIVNNEIVAQGGFRTMPYAILRFSGSGNYAEGPCALLLPDIKMLNIMNRDVMQAAELAVMPPMLAAEDGIFSAGFSLTPGAINYGGIDRQSGRQLAIPMDMGSNIPIGMEMMNQKREIINDGLWNTLFQILVDTPRMTATEAMLRAQEKGALLAPAGSRIEGEFLSKIVAREIDLLAINGELPEPPEAFANAGGEYEIEYTNPLARYRKSEDGVAIMRAAEQLGALAQIVGPEIMTRINFDEAAKILLDVNGVPASIIRSDEEMQQIAEAKAQEEQAIQEQAQLDNALAAAPLLAKAGKDMAQAQAIEGTAEGQALPNIFNE